MHLFMVQVDYKLIGTGCYNDISHSDSVTVVPSFYFYVRAFVRGKDKWLYPPYGCSQRT
jgi:hypothetical protein